MVSTALLVLAALLASDGPQFRPTTPVELAAAKQRLATHVADPDYVVLESTTSPGSAGDLVFLKVRCRAGGGYAIESWRVSVKDGVGGLTIEFPYPDKARLEAMGGIFDYFDTLGGGGLKPKQPAAAGPSGTADLAMKLPRPSDPSIRYGVVTDGQTATVYIWMQTRWREMGPAVMFKVETPPGPTRSAP